MREYRKKCAIILEKKGKSILATFPLSFFPINPFRNQKLFSQFSYLPLPLQKKRKWSFKPMVVAVYKREGKQPSAEKA